jgi:hypothetical protein
MIGSGGSMPTNSGCEPKFQSLLFWMIGSGPLCVLTVLFSINVVSILVVLDDWFGDFDIGNQSGHSRFQSLLFWMIGSGAVAVMLRHGLATGFNPCCFG